MKKICLIVLAILPVAFIHAQILTPVKWQYGIKKIGEKTYEIHLKAVIDSGWHTYSQHTPDGGPFPTNIIFTKDNEWQTVGKIKEVGKLRTKYEKAFGLDVRYYERSVDFVQVIKMNTIVSEKVSGTIAYMACMDKKCLAPETINFAVLVK